MELISKSKNVLQWCVSLACILAALFIASEHTAHFFATHNYFFSPFADDILDNANYSYPLAMGKIGYVNIFNPFMEHRVVIERIQEIIDFLFTNGVQTLQPYRLSLLLWLNFLIFSRYVIFSNNTLSKPLKIFLSGVYLLLLFPGMSINNFTSTMQITWPIIYLFSLLTFVSLAKYCDVVQQEPSPKKAWLYLLSTVVFLNIVLYTFNIGTLLWPIIFIVLIKQRCLYKHRGAWLLLAGMNFYLYLQKNWVSANFNSYTAHATLGSIFQKPVAAFLYFSRIIAVPFDGIAFYHFSWVSLSIGLFACLLVVLSAVFFWKKTRWSSSESVFFAYFTFVCFSIAVISIIRCASGRFELIEWRFLTTGVLFIFCSLMTLFLLPIHSRFPKERLHFMLSTAITVWLLGFFIPLDLNMSGGTYDLGFFNQVVISEATGIPIDEDFLQASKIYQVSPTLHPHVIVNEIQKANNKGPYSFWASKYINHPLNELGFKKIDLQGPAQIYIAYDYRPEKSPGVLVNVKLDKYQDPITKNREIIFTNDNDQIIGFAVTAPNLRPLYEMLTAKQTPPLLWRGAINTQYLDSSALVYAWVVVKDLKTIYKLGSLKIPSPMLAQQKPDWMAWEKSSHFGA
jgi:hypothetical protein